VICRITIGTECIVAFPLLQWLFERNTVLHYTYFTYLVPILFTMICRITIGTECIVAFPLQQWLFERDTMLHCTYFAYLVPILFK
jgi:hypothetical protein